MSEFTPPNLPKTKYEISAEIFLKVVKGESFDKIEGVYRLKPDEIKRQKILEGYDFHLNDNTDYIILKDASIIDIDVIELRNEVGASHIGFFLMNSVLPGFALTKMNIADWHLENSHINGDIFINENSQIGYIWIENNSKVGHISIRENSQVSGILALSNCHINSIFIIQSQIGRIDFEDGSYIEDIEFHKKSKCEGHITIKNSSRCRNIVIENNSRCGKIFIEAKSKCGDIVIKDTAQSDNIWVTEQSSVKNIQISNDSQSDDITFDNSIQEGHIWLRKDSRSGDVIFKNNSQSEAILIENNSQSGNIDIKNGNIKNVDIKDNFFSLVMHNTEFSKIEIENCKLGLFELKSGTTGEVYISNCEINHLNFNSTVLLKGMVVSLSDTQILLFTMEKFFVEGQLLLRKAIPMHDFHKWRNGEKSYEPNDNLSEQIYLFKKQLLEEQKKRYEKSTSELSMHYKVKPLFRVVHSSLGKTEMTGCNLEDFHFEYFNSKILDCFIAGTLISDIDIDIYNPDKKNKLSSKDYFEQKAAIYNQIKKIFENQGDVVEATRYHSKAMDNQHKWLQFLYKEKHSPRWYSISKWFTVEGFNLFNFWLNNKSNNHGESLRRAFGFVFITSLGFYSLYYLSFHYHESFSFCEWRRFVGDYFVFLDPTHKIDFHIEKESLWWLPKFFDFLSRIIIGYGIYQLIAAFRRYGRRNV